MADRMLFISWGAGVPGREERGLEVFNEAMGLYGRMQQEGRIESFDVAFMSPNPMLEGYIAVRGSVEQINAVREDEEYRRNLYDASLIVQNLAVCDAVVGEAVAQEVQAYQEAVSKVPQMA
jgi:hypothetical protein